MHRSLGHSLPAHDLPVEYALPPVRWPQRFRRLHDPESARQWRHQRQHRPGPPARQDRRVACFQERLLLFFLMGTGINVLAGVDEPRHGTHSFGVDRFQALRVGRTGADRDDLAG